ncbi:ArsR/SmtB family transcription factor [Phyllobacterium myrsinacearum]|uniref:Rhodanese-related sulfurtransferase/DNA-binding transcriptional ArsR family regulator n=1 Tax=Phyllobacterium myrsinacearum TaxID=28101 RepID=A0A839ES71_9HYPH|nr:metalloregulator ArsR/SmtB family transcription factor [Phyllobacterium myrsinacearum]MBA8879287.1 rhodanese-related sulfurtransferase/DNA-binding transcriptional ArsR family regulator [Phyllobacterium myrsinacearum]
MMKNDAHTLLFSELAEIARTLGHAHRLMLLEHIAQGERPVERLADLTGLTIANTSQHLQLLRRAGFVETRREGKRVLYRLGNGPIETVLASLRAYAEHTRAEIRDLVSDPINSNGRLDSISREDLLERLAAGSVTLLDVRSSEEYALGHLPGALNIPADELEQRLTELPSSHEIVAYCRGPYCVLSTTAAEMLEARGFRVRRLASGFPDWKAADLQVEQAAA